MGRKDRRRLRQIIVIDLLLVLCILCAVAIGKLVHKEPDVPLTLNGDQEITVALGEEFVDPGAEPDGVTVSGTVDTNTPGTYTLEYSYRDETMTRTVHVTDPDRIVIGLKGSAVQLVKKGDPYIENGAFATDKQKGAISSDSITAEGDVDTDTPGEYTVTYTASSDGNSASAVRTVKVLSADDFGPGDTEASVLFYNHVYTSNDIPSGLNGNWILDTDLEEHLKYLKDGGYYYPGWKELRAWLDGKISLPEKSIMLTFDGGKKEFLKYGLPLLEKYEIPATLFLTCWKKNGAVGKIKHYPSPYLDVESNSYAMKQAGQTRGYRGIIADMTKDEILEDLKKAQAVTGNNDAFSYPYGDVTSDAMEAVREQGILCAFITDYGRVAPGMDPMRLPRVRVLGDESFEVWRQSVR